VSCDDQPIWVMGPISEMVQLSMERFQQKWLDKLHQPGWGDAAEFICERDMKCGTAALRDPAGDKR
jgi:hypothetical protein